MKPICLALVFAFGLTVSSDLPAQAPPDPQGFIDAFILTERVKLADRVQKEGERFDPARAFEGLHKKHEKVFGTGMSPGMAAEFDRVAREAAARPPIPFDPNRKGSSPIDSSPELYLANAKVKFLEDIREEGNRFETAKEFAKVAERFERNFGMAMPIQMQNELNYAADQARTITTVQRAERAAANSNGPPNAARPGPMPKAVAPKVAPVFQRGVRYPEGLPDWFQARDQNHDGQLGVYEWDRDRLAEFRKWDLNGDGFLEPLEVLKTYRQMVPAADKTKPAGSK